MSKNHNRYINAAYSVALASPGAGGKNRNRFRLGAVLVDRKRIVAAKYNSLKTHPMMGFFYAYPYLHAEAATIFSYGIDNCYGSTLYVVRIKRDNSLGLAKPCSSCEKLIKLAGVKQVIYSTNEGIAEL